MSCQNEELCLLFVSSEHLLGGHLASLKDVDVKKKMIKEPVPYERLLQRVFATNSFGLCGIRAKSLVLMRRGDLNRSIGLWVANAFGCFD